MVWGSWTELVVGLGSLLVAAVLGSLAWREAKQATLWAKRATGLSEAALQIGFTASMYCVTYHDGDGPGQRFDAWLVLGAEHGASVVFVHGVKTAGAFLWDRPDSSVIPIGEMLGRWDVEPNPDVILPRRLHPGESIFFANPWQSFTPEPVRGSSARVTVAYSATGEPPIREVDVQVSLPIDAAPRGSASG